jgi:hypothetical protein
MVAWLPSPAPATVFHTQLDRDRFSAIPNEYVRHPALTPRFLRIAPLGYRWRRAGRVQPFVEQDENFTGSCYSSRRGMIETYASPRSSAPSVPSGSWKSLASLI